MHTSSFPQCLRAMICDFDGTLSVPTLDFEHMRRRAMDALRPFTPLDLSTTVPAMEELERVCRSMDPETARAARKAALAAVAEVEVEAARRSSLFPFVRPMLAALKERNMAFAVITRNCPAAVRTVFPDVDEYAACLLTRDDVAKVKPHPAHLEEALKRLSIAPQEAIMVGDHPMDIQVGKAAGTWTAGVASGEATLERLAREEPDRLARDAGELARCLGVM